ncbi:YdcF family protein [Halogeometricum limi]|uniref:DUF218 domain-containing protein n=1 Tax=Halogeometricum limi TaxID=555875 RepID=A0A1I6IB38_9EURY|nr:YdcF family protein [Halogeometricum limi]SFR64025.1 DUF218 domain-containing protein [Halogeometricum limi]
MIVVVLGHRLESNHIHDRLRRRVEMGMKAFDVTDASHLVFTGAQTNPEVERTECGVMGDYAVRRGVDPDRILLDPSAYDTIGNAYFTRVLVDDVGLDVRDVAVVTDDFHARRSQYAFEQCFGRGVAVDTTYAVETDTPVDSHGTRSKLAQTESFFESITPGDIEAIQHRLHTDHDCYEFPEAVETVSV